MTTFRGKLINNLEPLNKMGFFFRMLIASIGHFELKMVLKEEPILGPKSSILSFKLDECQRDTLLCIEFRKCDRTTKSLNKILDNGMFV